MKKLRHDSSGDHHDMVKMLLIAAATRKKADDYIGSLQKLNKAYALSPENQEILFQMAVLYQEIGEIDKAIESVKSALKLNPFFSDGLRLLAEMDVGQFSEEDLVEIKKKIINPQTNNNDRANLAFTLFEIYEARADYDSSYEYLDLGNRSKRQTFHYDFKEQKEYLLKVRDYFTQILAEFPKKNAVTGITPVFIVGMPRSGTTLVEQILASHPDVLACGELSGIPQIVKKLLAEHVTLSSVITSSLEGDDLRKYGLEYFEQITSLQKSGVKYFTDKMPQNFFFLGLIRVLFPAAKIVHCRRNPMATIYSCYKTLFTEKGQQFTFDINELGQFYLFYRETMDHWHSVMPGDIYEINYEELVGDQEGESRKLIDFCDLTWSERCLDFHKTKRAVNTASSLQVIRPIYSSSISQWENYQGNLKQFCELLVKHNIGF